MANIQEKLDKGYIQSRIILEMIGKPKEHVDDTLKKYVEHIKKSSDIELLNQNFVEAKESEDNKGFWTAFVELELLTKNITALTGFCFDYMPSSIEIIAPAELRIKGAQLSNIINDLQGKLHKLDMMVKQLDNENHFLKRNTFFLATNIVSILLKAEVKNLKDLSRLSGMSEEDMNGFLEKLIKQKFVKKEGDSYAWIKDVKREE